MSHLIVGTAGHIDHGKTSLVRALTGVDTDRLKEEKARGISIELGFAHLELPGDLRVALVDVPGHERFVRNMLAGATGIDAVLFVVAADESIKPQTREHFDICRLLGIERGLVVLTKADLVDEEIVGLVRMEVEEFVAGSFLEGAPIRAVSAATGAGLDGLRLDLAKIGATAKDPDGDFRLSIDRAFSLHGFGTVVTGTVASGTVRTDDELELHPRARRVRVRGVQVHGKERGRVRAGERCALNLAGITAAELERGMTLAAPGIFQPVRELAARLELLPSAGEVKSRFPARFHVGCVELEAEVRLVDDSRVRPLARIVLGEETLILPGDRFVLRRPSPADTLGGGRVIDLEWPRLRRSEVLVRLRFLESAGRAQQIAHRVQEARLGVEKAQLRRLGYLERELKSVVLIHPDRLEALRESARAILAAHHAESPLSPGVPREELRERLLGTARPDLLAEVLASQQFAGGDVVRLSSHQLSLRSDEDEALSRIEDSFRNAGLAVPAVDEILGGCGVDGTRAKSLLAILTRDGRLVRIGSGLVYHREAIQSLRQLMGGRKGARFGVSEFKDWTGVSRKFAIPLLEFLDRERVTRRDGDARVVL
jgi:selenocysteine-specific elongation factor